jgi:hypothetical protein
MRLTPSEFGSLKCFPDFAAKRDQSLYAGLSYSGDTFLRHQLHYQKFQGPTPSSLFAAFKPSQNNLEKLDYRAQSVINRII